MLLNFSTYLVSHSLQHNVRESKKNLKTACSSWLKEIHKSLIQYEDQFPENFLTSLLGPMHSDSSIHPCPKLYKQLTGFIENDYDAYSSIKAIDAYYNRLLHTLNTVFVRQFQYKKIPTYHGFFQFESKHRGVGFTFRLVDHHGSVVPGSLIETQSTVGISFPKKKTSPKSLNPYIGKNKLLNNALEKMNTTHRELTDHHAPHAEDFFFGHHLDQALELIHAFNRTLPFTYIAPQDDLWLTHLSGPRIEFVQTSSICNKCKPYFKALRLILNDAGIRLPMLMFAQSAYNPGEPSKPVAFIDMHGDYQCHKISWSDSPDKTPSIQGVEHLDAMNASATAVLPLLWRDKFLSLRFWEKLVSAPGNSDYFIWLAEFTTRLFQNDQSLKSTGDSISNISLLAEDFPDLPPSTFQALHQSVCNGSIVHTQDENLTPRNAYFELLLGANYISTGEDMTRVEFLYWTILLDKCSNGDASREPAVDNTHDFTLNDLASLDRFLRRLSDLDEDSDDNSSAFSPL